MTEISSKELEKKNINVLGKKMTYVERGEGDPIIFHQVRNYNRALKLGIQRLVFFTFLNLFLEFLYLLFLFESFRNSIQIPQPCNGS